MKLRIMFFIAFVFSSTFALLAQTKVIVPTDIVIGQRIEGKITVVDGIIDTYNIPFKVTTIVTIDEEGNEIKKEEKVPDYLLKDFVYGLPNLNARGYIVLYEVEKKTVSLHIYHTNKVEGEIEKLPIEQGRYALASDTNNTWYCTSSGWVNNSIN